MAWWKILIFLGVVIILVTQYTNLAVDFISQPLGDQEQQEAFNCIPAGWEGLEVDGVGPARIYDNPMTSFGYSNDETYHYIKFPSELTLTNGQTCGANPFRLIKGTEFAMTPMKKGSAVGEHIEAYYGDNFRLGRLEYNCVPETIIEDGVITEKDSPYWVVLHIKEVVPIEYEEEDPNAPPTAFGNPPPEYKPEFKLTKIECEKTNTWRREEGNVNNNEYRNFDNWNNK